MRLDGQLEFLGRLDDQVKIHGVRIEPGEVTAHLMAHPAVREAAVLARKNPAGSLQLAAYVAAEDGFDLAEMRAFLSKRLAEAWIPAFLVQVGGLPQTSNGKLDRRALPDPEWRASAGQAAHPPSPLQARLLEIWRGVLGVDDLTIQDDFFAAGGYSLLSVKLAAEVSRQLGCKLPLSAVFQAPSVERMASYIEQLSPAGMEGTLLELTPGRSGRPFFFFPPVSGILQGFQHLAAYAPENRPVLGIESRGLEGVQAPIDSIPEQAAEAIRQMRAIQPEGPYDVGGYSFGGYLAYEVACQLAAEGLQVGRVIFLDTNISLVPGFTQAAGPWKAARYHAGLAWAQFWFHIARLRHLLWKERWAYLTERTLKRLDFPAPERPGSKVAEEYAVTTAAKRVLEANRRAIRAYRPKPYPGRVILIRAERQHPTHFAPLFLGWDWFARGGVEVHILPGDHATLLSEQNLRGVGEKLRAVLSDDSA